jgi:hypothetical protein
MPYRDQMGFDFRANYESQALQMLEKYHMAQMCPSGDWPRHQRQRYPQLAAALPG